MNLDTLIVDDTVWYGSVPEEIARLARVPPEQRRAALLGSASVLTMRTEPKTGKRSIDARHAVQV